MTNLLTRAASGVLFLAIMIGGIIFDQRIFFVLTCFIVVVGMLEFFKMLIPEKKLIQKSLSIIAGLSLVTIAFLFAMNISGNMAIIIFLFALLPLLITLIYIAELYQQSAKPFENIALLILPIFYIAMPFALMHPLFKFYKLDCSSCSGALILAFFIIVWANDVGAYCFGMAFGRHGKHKLFPSISPKKSWEGFIGGLVVSIITGILVSKFLLQGALNNMFHWIAIAIITCIFGVFGDLVESMLKRSANVKDSGNIMPGHGGILDRFDAVFLAFPLVFIYIITFF